MRFNAFVLPCNVDGTVVVHVDPLSAATVNPALSTANDPVPSSNGIHARRFASGSFEDDEDDDDDEEVEDEDDDEELTSHNPDV